MTARTHTIDPAYERKMVAASTQEYYDHSDFYNFGYWRHDTRSQREACENLMERLLGFIPSKEGKILDVACGLGATTRHLLRYYEPRQVMAVNISPRQIERGRRNAPGATFFLMDATRLAFEDNSVGNIISVEAAIHFLTRERFFREAYRILAPGGHLVLTDILVRPWTTRVNPRLPRENVLDGLEEYAALYRRVGFEIVEIEDATDACWTAHSRFSSAWRRRRVQEGGLGRLPYWKSVVAHKLATAGMMHYVVAAVRKPTGK